MKKIEMVALAVGALLCFAFLFWLNAHGIDPMR
jgi:hypothetical protein